jgi:hypothetical protein
MCNMRPKRVRLSEIDAPTASVEENRMPLYFFDLDDGEFVHDEVGVECPDFDAVRREAKRALPALAQEILPEDGDHRTMRAIVRNENDDIVYTATLTFSGRLA